MATKLDSGISDYLKQIKHFELLTAEQERELGSKIRAATESEERLARGELSIFEHEKLQREAAEAREKMISANYRLVISVAKNFRNRGLPMEDLISEGNLGLMQAVDRYDPAVGSRFSTYASYWIDQAIRRAVQSTQMIHIPSYLIEQIGHMRLAMRELETRLGRQPTMQELARYMDISPKRAGALCSAIRACTCPNQSANTDDGSSLTESLPDTRTPAPQDAIFSESDAGFVGDLLIRITEREAEVLKMRYGLGPTGKAMTLKEIGDAVGLTRERVRQIEKEAKKKLEDWAKECL